LGRVSRCRIRLLRSREKNRRALLIISDGMDNLSRSSKSELVNIVLERDTQMDTLALAGTRADVKGADLAEIQRARNSCTSGTRSK
jgi:hypothetical protein